MAKSVLDAWKRVDLPALQRKLDDAAADIAGRQDEADESRKKLVELSKEFRQKTPEDVRKQVSPLMKTFQGEIDSLTKRSKAAESAFLDVYKQLAEAPDPTPSLEHSSQWQAKAQKLHDAELEVSNLRQTIASYNEEFAEIRNQDVTIRQLRETIKAFEDDMQAQVQAKLQDQERAQNERFEERQRKLDESESLLELKLQEAERRAESLQSSLTAAQRELFELRSRNDDSQTARSDEVDMLSQDLERAVHRAESAERELIVLKERVKDQGSQRCSIDEDEEAHRRDQLTALEVELSAKDKQIAQLIDENKRLNTRVAEEGFENRAEIERLQRELDEKLDAVEVLEAKMSKQADYEDLKRELKVMKSIEFGENEGRADEPKSLEVLLLEKNKSCQSDNTMLKLAKQDLEGSVTPPAPFQPVVDAIGRLVGQEMAACYSDPLVDRQLEKQLRRQRRQMSAESFSDAKSDGTSSFAAVDLPKRYKDKELFDFDLAIKEGMPKTVAETAAITELHTVVAENVRLLGQRALNTVEIARQCRRLMIAYNLGQRLFAKTVMNQSQGSLSELLSKPRHWNRLTEKGREAFRRIFAWVSDDHAIQLLCSISPRRVGPAGDVKVVHPSPESLLDTGSDYGTDAIGDYCASTDENVHRRLSLSISVSSDKVVDGPKSFDHSPKSGSRAVSKSSSRWRHDDISKEQILSIFQSELAKLKDQESHLEKAMRSRPARTDSAISAVGPISPSGSSDCSSRSSVVDKSSCNSLVKLEQLANSTPTSNNPTHPLFSSPTMKTKTGLTPVTQEQFEAFAHLDTEDIVRQIKDYLSTNSVSQRQFGEHVLGLSQGSVSDLLARPKPWNMLTQKGREPFIRMRLFLDDGNTAAGLRSRRRLASATPPSISNLPTPVSKVRDSSEHSSVERNKQCPDTTKYVPLTVSSIAGNALDACGSEDDEAPPLIVDEEDDIAVVQKSISPDPHAEHDTADIVRQVKDLLHFHGIAQKSFGEVILGVGPGGTSELLSKPKPWTQLSSRGKEPYLKMRAWLAEPNHMDKLIGAPPPSTVIVNGHKRSVTAADEPLFIPRKSARTVISEQQKEALKFAFAHDPHPSTKTNEFLAKELGLNVRTVTNWFHNYRTRQKANLGRNSGGGGRPLADDSDAWRLNLIALIQTSAAASGAAELEMTANDSSATLVSTTKENGIRLRKTSDGGLLDRAVAKMREMAAARTS